MSLVADSDEAAPRHLPALQLEPQLGMEMAGNFRRADRRAPLRGEGRSRRPRPPRRCARRNGRQSPDRGCRRSTPSRAARSVPVSSSRACVGQAVAAEAVVEAVAEAIEALRAGALDLAASARQRRVRIVGRQELAEPREPARFFEVQVGDQQRLLRRPEERAVGRRRRTFRLRTKREPWRRFA